MKNERLIANAGSGKTFDLTHRLIRLLAAGVEPSRIAALTFTRKAAGEFLQSVLGKLANAAIDPARLSEVRQHARTPGLTHERCLEVLVKVVSQLDHLGMGTIDSLFARIARSFPIECGLSEDFRIADEMALERGRHEALALLFHASGKRKGGLDELVELVRRISRARGERDIFDTLLRTVAQCHEKFLQTPPSARWGDASRIWRKPSPVMEAPAVRLAASGFRDAVMEAVPGLSAEAITKLDRLLDHVVPLDHGAVMNKEALNFLQGPLTKDYKRGQIQLTRSQTGWIPLTPRVDSARRELALAVARSQFVELLRRSAALYEFMGIYEGAYSSLVRGNGTVGFADITGMLARLSDDPQWVADVGYRIDQFFDHWLLDEFQDTSRLQWRVLEPFVSEVLMDPGGRRSFYYVGDTKQAIYGWRGGDAQLFTEVFDEAKGAISDAPPLKVSFRSRPVLTDFINRVFGNVRAHAAELKRGGASVSRWEASWNDHSSAPGLQGKPGFVSWRPVSDEDPGDEESDAIESAVREVIREVEPWRRGIVCAVLTRKNDEAARIASLLRDEGIPVSLEGKSNPCMDHPMGIALLHSLRALLQPRDTLSHTLARGFPGAAAWGTDSLDLSVCRREALDCIARDGYSALIHKWIDALPDTPGLQEQATPLIEAACEFDEIRLPGDGVSAFLRHLEGRTIQEVEGAGCVRVMTIHQSKGLGFDMAVVVGLDARQAGGGNDLVLGPGARRIEWGLLMPSKDVANLDPVLADQVERRSDEDSFSELCTSYVALTRARQALYVLTRELKATSRACHFARHLMLSLNGSGYEAGNPCWYGDPEWERTGDDVPPESGDSASTRSLHGFRPPGDSLPSPVTPSTQTPNSGGDPDAMDLGSRIHTLLAGLEWGGNDQSFPNDEAGKLVAAFLSTPDAQHIFCRPGGHVPDVWRERSFDLILEKEWVSGTFDRVHIFRDSSGKPESAEIFDFKTGRPAENLQQRHAAQLEIYRRALATLLDLPAARIGARAVPIRPH